MIWEREWRGRPWWGTSVALSFFCFILSLSVVLTGVSTELGNRINDSFFRLRNRPTDTSSVVVVLIDDAALSQQGRWPWPRRDLAHLIDIIAAGHPRTIGLDVLLSEASDTLDDDALQRSLMIAGNVILPAKITTSSTGPLWIEPLPIFAAAARGIGHVQAVLDADGVCRRLPEAEMSLQGRLPMMAELLADAPQTKQEAAKSQGFRVLLPKAITIDYRGLASAGPPFFRPFSTVSAASLLRGERDDLHGKTVLVGFAGTGLEDELLTPLTYTAPVPGVLIQANMVDTLQRSRSLKMVDPFGQIMLLLLICLLGGRVMRRQNSRRIALWITVSAAATYGLAYVCFVVFGLQFAIGPAVLAEILIVPLGQLQHILVLQALIGTNLLDLQKQAEGLPLHIAGVLLPGLATIQPFTSRTDAESKLNLIARTDRQIAIVSAFQQSLLGSMRDGIAVFDHRGRQMFENPAWREFLALSNWRREESWQELLKALEPGQSGLKESALEQTTEERAVEVSTDREVLISGRLWRISLISLPPVASFDETLYMVLAADLTPQMERDQARQQALQFITHELRTPLVSLLGFAELLQHFPEQAKEAGAVGVIQQESERLIALTTMFLECLRLETALPVIAPTETHVDTLIERTTSLAEPLCMASNKRLIVKMPSRRTNLYVDSAMMTGALLNLVANAVKYGTDGADIEIRVELEDDMAIFGVYNRGPRIPEEEFSLLFTPQYRMTQNTIGRTGWGIGLAFVKKVMDAHRGEVKVRSNDTETGFQLLLSISPRMHGARS